ncbi:MAG: hypothetical protein VX768_20675 [Planctomycetota bacterium]|nr:hypothetical protein [Planctomycetota bacterium]
MNPSELVTGKWYWVQKPNGTIVPYRLNRLLTCKSGRKKEVEMYVGSMIQTFAASQLLGPAEMPVQPEAEQR